MGQLEIVLARIRDRVTLEDENRLLLRQMQSVRGTRMPLPDIAQRLERIERVLVRLESALLSRTPL